MGRTTPRMSYLIDIPEMLDDHAYGVRAHRKFVQDSLTVVLADHHARRIPGHFKPWAVAYYGYKPRSKAYTKRKLRLKGHNDPLVYTGITRDAVTRRLNIVGRGRGTGKITKALTYRLPFKGGSLRFKKQTEQSQRILQMAGEIAVVAPNERDAMAKMLSETYVAAVKENTKTRRRRRRRSD